MKRLTLTLAAIAVLAMVTSCTVTQETTMRHIDLSQFAKQDFLITPHQYNGEYITVGYVEFTYVPELESLSVKERSKLNMKEWAKVSTTYYTRKEGVQGMMEKVQAQVKELGGDGIMDLVIIAVDNPAYHSAYANTVRLSGWAIDRK